MLLIGAGGLGCPLAQYLAAAGVGTLGLVDSDRVEASNLQRQVLYGTADVGRPKVEVAAERIRAQNPDVRVVTHAVRLTSENALELLADWDVIVDGSDNFPTRYLVNDACVLLGKPNVHGSIFRFDGQASVFDARVGPCYRCLYPEPPPPGAVPSCAEGGVLGVLPGLVALIQATETLKLLAGIGDSLCGRLLQIDALGMEFREFRIQKDPKCPACGEQPTLTQLIDYEGFCGMPSHDRARRGAARDDTQGAASGARARRGAAAARCARALRARAGEASKARSSCRSASSRRASDELDAWRRKRIVIHCHHGGRSARACGLLRDQGFEQVENLAGGIDAWSQSVDPSVPRY